MVVGDLVTYIGVSRGSLLSGDICAINEFGVIMVYITQGETGDIFWVLPEELEYV